MKILTGLAITFAIVTQPAFAAPKHQSAAAKVEAIIRKLDVDWNKVTNAKQWVTFYSKDAVLLPPNEPIADTPAKILKSMTAFLSTPGVKVSWTCEKVKVSRSADMAYCYGHYKVMFNGKDGKPVTDTGKTLEIWGKQKDGSWKCVLDTYNSDLPAGS